MLLLNPCTFLPENEGQYALLNAWNKIEPNKPESFGYYLSVYKRGLPPHKFFQFVSEIEQDSTIRNRGAVFVTKVQKYFDLRNTKN